VPAVLVTLALGVFCFCAVALAVTALIPRGDSALPVAWGTILPLCFISDIFVPIEGAPRWLQDVASFFPLRGFADDLEAAFNPVTGSHSLQAGHLELLALWGVAAAAFALLTFRWEPSSGGGSREGISTRTTFAIDRARELFLKRDGPRRPSRQVRAEPRPRTFPAPADIAAPGRPPPRESPSEIERIEGPAPTEDGSVPSAPT